MPTIVLHVAYLTAGLSALMLLPSLTALSRGEIESLAIFLATALLVAGLSLALIAALRGTTAPVRRIHAMWLACLVWPIIAAIGGIPIWFLTDLAYGAASFEAISAVTTTGFTLVVDLETLPVPVLVWRSALQWYGGLITLLVATQILAPLAIGGLPQRQLSFIDDSDAGRKVRTASQVQLIGGAYGATTLACLLWLLFSSVTPMDALILSMTTVSTGGMTSYNAPIDTYVPPLGQIGLIVFMIIGCTSIVWQGAILRRDVQQLSRHREAYYTIGTIIVVGIVFGLLYQLRSAADLSGALTALREGLFAAASLVSTTGYHVREESFSVLPVGVIFAFLLIGGGALSTAGGLKMFRVGILCAQSARELSLSLFPHGVEPLNVGGRRWQADALQGIYAVVLAFVLVLGLTVAVLSYQGLAFEPTIMAGIAALSNAGPVYGAGPDAQLPWPPLSSFGSASLAALSGAMIMGRVEVLVFFSVINLTYWRSG